MAMATASSLLPPCLTRIDPDAMLARTLDWAAVNSGTGNLDGLSRMAGKLVAAFAALPGDIALIEPEAVDAMAPDGALRPVGHGRHLHLHVRPQAPVQLLFTGHMDTVFAADHAFQSCRWLPGGTLNGPGVADMKGGLSLLLEALLAIEHDPRATAIGYDVMINSDEETGSASSRQLIARLSAGKAAALTYEPALPDGTLAGARAGSGNFSIRVTGRSAHAGRNPDDGRNAIVAASDIALRLKQASGGTLSCNPARIDGGAPNNMVPDHAILRVNFRPHQPADEERARTLVDQVTVQVAREHDVGVHVHGGFGRPPKPIDPAAERLFTLVRDQGRALGLDLSWKATGGVCDGNNIAACGVPVVDTMGARGGAIHSEEEFLIVESLEERAKLSALTILALADGGAA